MSGDLMRLNFEGSTLTTLRYQGRPCWIAGEVGTLLGYAQAGKRLATKVTGDWSDEFVEGKDHCVIRGKELEQFRLLIEASTESEPAFTPLFQVGRVISQLGLRGNHPGLSKAIVNKAKGHERTVTTYLYSPRAVAQIEAELGAARAPARRLAAADNVLEAE
jgi:hypothetical protein